MNQASSQIFDDWLRHFVADSDDPFIHDSESMMRRFLELAQSLPSKYGWKIRDVENFRSSSQSCKSAEEFNSLYWRDIARNIEAYDVMLVWRAAELLAAGISSMNKKEVLPGALLARGVLELAATLITNVNTVEATVKEVLMRAESGTILVSEELERLLLRMIHGTRIGAPEDHIKQTNVLTHLQRLSKNPRATELMPVYEFLCDATHPNVVGNARFWGCSVPAGSAELLTIEREAEFLTTVKIREKILWAFAWSAACIQNGFEIGQSAVASLLTRWSNDVSD